MTRKNFVSLTALTLMLTLATACGGKGEQGQTAAGPVWKPTGNEGSISGAISFTGAVPAPKKLDTESDPKCGDVYLNDVIVNNGKLQNVFIYVKSGLPEANFAVPTEAVMLDQKNCSYVPRVLGIQTGQTLQVTNSDQTTHNIHPVPHINREWNESQLPGQGPIIRKFTKPETMIPVKCNQHSWMLAHIGVLSHPFYAVSDASGTFTIKGLPPGEYEIEAWHERYGAKTMKVTVPEKGDAKTDFSFDGATAYQPSSLKLQPAMMVH